MAVHLGLAFLFLGGWFGGLEGPLCFAVVCLLLSSPCTLLFTLNLRLAGFSSLLQCSQFTSYLLKINNIKEDESQRCLCLNGLLTLKYEGRCLAKF